jgi:hypothetical protein
MVGQYQVRPETSLLGLDLLMLQGLVERRDPAVENCLHFSCFDVSAEVSSDHRPVPRGKSDLCGRGLRGFFDDL